MTFQSLIRQSRIALVLHLLVGGVALGAESYMARAEELRSADGKLRTAPVTLSVDRMLTTAERDTLLEAFMSGDATALRKALAAQPSLGCVEGGKARVPVKFAFPRSTGGGGKVVTIVCNEPIVRIGQLRRIASQFAFPGDEEFFRQNIPVGSQLDCSAASATWGGTNLRGWHRLCQTFQGRHIKTPVPQDLHLGPSSRAHTRLGPEADVERDERPPYFPVSESRILRRRDDVAYQLDTVGQDEVPEVGRLCLPKPS